MKSNIFLFLMCFMAFTAHADFVVTDFGAKADGKTPDTRSVQAAIDAAHQNGGGRVIIPAGKTVITGSLYMKSFVTLYIENGATLKGSSNITDYTTDTHKNMYKNEAHMDRCLIYANGAESIAFEGYGCIDGNGYQKYFTRKTGRPMLIRLMNCHKIQMRNITLVNPAVWTSAWLYCSDIVVDGIRIRSRVNHNGDGLDFDGCTNVRVSNCSFDTSDDSICLQASLPDQPCTDVVISNCIFGANGPGCASDFYRVEILNRCRLPTALLKTYRIAD